MYEQFSSFLGDMTGTAHSYDDDEKWWCDWEKANPNNRHMNCRETQLKCMVLGWELATVAD